MDGRQQEKPIVMLPLTAEISEKIVSYPTTIASSDFSVMMLLGQRLDSLSESQAVYFSNMMREVIDRIAAHIIEETAPLSSLVASKDRLIRAFIYCFDKSVETVYNLRAEVDAAPEFNYEDLYHGMGGDGIPEYIQLKVTPLIGKIATVFSETFDFVNKQYAEKHELKELIRAILFGGMLLGTEFCLRIDLQDFSEYSRLMEE